MVRYYNRPDRRNDQRQDGRQKTNWFSIREVRLIDENGDMVGVVSTQEALHRAKEAGLELVNVSPNAVPPVCKICDYGKFKYEQQKKQKGNNKGTKKTKEVQFSIHIEKNDLDVKINRAIGFLEEKNTVLIVMQLKGRDMQRTDFAMELMNKICETLKPHCKSIDEPKMTGRKIVAMCR